MSNLQVNSQGNREQLREKILRFLPKGTHYKVTDEILDMALNMGESTGLFQDYMEEKLFSYFSALKETKVGLEDYINAVKYCALKKTMSNEKAWSIVFPDRYNRLVKEGKQISNHVAMYNSRKIVTKIDALMLTELHIQYAPVFHEAIQTQINLMRGFDANGKPTSAHVQHMAANTLIEKLAPPKEETINVKIGVDDHTRDMQVKTFETLQEIAKKQQELLAKGANLSDIQKLNLKVHDVSDAEIEDAE